MELMDWNDDNEAKQLDLNNGNDMIEMDRNVSNSRNFGDKEVMDFFMLFPYHYLQILSFIG